jgi:hypothetical protein
MPCAVQEFFVEFALTCSICYASIRSLYDLIVVQEHNNTVVLRDVLMKTIQVSL